jgi:ribosomal protein L12E/L44/L45/RPP1/RPP2
MSTEHASVELELSPRDIEQFISLYLKQALTPESYSVFEDGHTSRLDQTDATLKEAVFKSILNEAVVRMITTALEEFNLTNLVNQIGDNPTDEQMAALAEAMSGTQMENVVDAIVSDELTISGNDTGKLDELENDLANNTTDRVVHSSPTDPDSITREQARQAVKNVTKEKINEIQ